MLLDLLGVESPSARLLDWELIVRTGQTAAWLLLLAAALGTGGVWLYLRETSINKRRRLTLAVLRCTLFVLLLGLLLQPTLRFTLEGEVRRLFVVLADTSASMGITDKRVDVADKARQAIALGQLAPDSPLDAAVAEPFTPAPRLDLLRGALANPQLDLLARLQARYDVRPYQFGQEAASLETQPDEAAPAWPAALTADAPVTAMGEGISQVLARTRGQPLAGIFLATDGQSNTGSAPLAAARTASRLGVPLYVWGVGLERQVDIAMEGLFGPEVAFIDENANFTARLFAEGMAGQRAPVVLRRGETVVAEETITFDRDGRVDVPLSFKPEEAGEFKLTAEVAAMPAEAVTENNSRVVPLRVVDGKIKVLYVERQPRWEFKYLQATLLRDPRIELTCLLLEADPSLAQVEGGPYISRFPATDEALFEYNLVILGDVDPRELSGEQAQRLVRHVGEFGAGLIVIAGRRHAPADYAGTALADLLPVELERTAPAAGNRPRQVRLTTAGLDNPMLLLDEDPEASRRLWAELPPIFWAAAGFKPKPGATTLLTAGPTTGQAAADGQPLAVLHAYGFGQVLLIATDNTWRWRRNVGDVYYSQLWGQIVQRLALPHLLGETSRTRLSTDRREYGTGDRVTVYARLFDTGFRPIDQQRVEATYSVAGADGAPAESRRFSLAPVPEQPGVYRGEFVAAVPGEYTLGVETDTDAAMTFGVAASRLEFNRLAMNAAELQELARATGGDFFREEDLLNLPGAVEARAERVLSSRDLDLWSSPAALVLILIVAGAEWALRKRWELK